MCNSRQKMQMRSSFVSSKNFQSNVTFSNDFSKSVRLTVSICSSILSSTSQFLSSSGLDAEAARFHFSASNSSTFISNMLSFADFSFAIETTSSRGSFAHGNPKERSTIDTGCFESVTKYASASHTIIRQKEITVTLPCSCDTDDSDLNVALHLPIGSNAFNAVLQACLSTACFS